MWELVLKLGHQLRVNERRVVGFDFVAAFALAAASGVPAAAVAEWLPQIEQVAVSEMNRVIMESSSNG